MNPNYSLQRPDYALQTGWTPIPHKINRTGELSFYVICSRSTYMVVGDKLLLTQGGIDKFFEIDIISVSGSTTTVTLVSAAGSTIEDAPIEYAYFSKLDRAYGAPTVAGCQFKTGIFMTPHGADPFTQSITGVGFKPKAIIFLGVCGQTPSAENQMGVGITDGLLSFSMAGTTVDGGASGGEGPTQDTVFQQIDTVGAVTMSANLVSMDDDGFTLFYSVRTVNPYNIAYLVMG